MSCRPFSIRGSARAGEMRTSSAPGSRLPMLLGCALLAVIAGLVAAAPVICPAGPLARVSAALQPPSHLWLAGTDDIGRSVSCTTLYGLTTSLVVGLAAGILSLSLGTIVGVL